MSFVFDSSSLIYLGKTQMLERVAMLKGKEFIPQSVYEEVVTKGLERGEPEAKYIEKLIKKDFIIQSAKSRIKDIPFLSKADKEVICLAKETKSIPVIDELYASDIAEAHGLESHGTIYLVLKLVKEKVITKKQAINCINKMVESGFYLSADKFKEIQDMIEKLKL